MNLLLYARLGLMVFLHYFVWSAWYVTMGNYTTTVLGFTGSQVGLAYGSTAVGALLAPFIAGILADRFFATQRVLACLHLAGAALLFWISTLKEFGAFYPALLIYTATYMAGHALTNSLTLRHSKNPAKEFPLVMIMASVGWIVAGLLVSWLKVENNAGMFRLAAGSALCMGLYSLTLPNTPPLGAGVNLAPSKLFGLDALKLLKNRSFATFMICSMLICVPLSFYFSWMNVFMNEMKIPNAAAKMTLGQVSDMVFLLLLPVLLPRLGAKRILMLGMLAWSVRFGLFALFGQQPTALWMLFTGILLHGICYDFIFVMGRMYVDKHAGEEIRASAQGLHAVFTLGAGMFIGTWLSGWVTQHYTHGSTHEWHSIWLIPAALGAVLTIVFGLLFKDDRNDSCNR